MATVDERRRLAATVAVLAVCAAGHSTACEPFVYLGNSIEYDSRIEVTPDCSFKDVYTSGYRDGGRDVFMVDTKTGGAARDFGGGRVAQKIVDGQVCGANEMLLFIDCNAAEAILIDGRTAPGNGMGWSGALIKFIQPPHGPIRITGTTTVAQLAKIVAANELQTSDMEDVFGSAKNRDSYDYTCGCKLFYPGSPGAGGAGG